MKAKELRNRYPKLWKEMEQGMLFDIDILYPKMLKSTSKTIAHNAAFLACAFMNDMFNRGRV